MSKIRSDMAITFDDVLLAPQKSDISSRSDVDLSTNLTRNIKIRLPIISGNMDTVTEHRMAIALAREGGIGIVHRFLSIEDHVREIERVKRFENFRIDNPITAPIGSTFGDIKLLMDDHDISSVLIVDEAGILQGLISMRDWMFVTDQSTPVAKIMTSVDQLITSGSSTTLEMARKIFAKNKIEKLPLVDKRNKLMGLITSHDVLNVSKVDRSSRDQKGRLLVGGAVGVKDTDFARVGELVNVGCDVIVLDIAHGHSTHLIKALKKIKKSYPKIDVIAGNVATYQGAKDLIEAGADAIKVGIGPGSLCTTRIVAGAGVPQVTAIMDACRATVKNKVPVIADGGIRYSGDIVKALASGASTVMIGSLFAGCKESPAITFYRGGEKYKLTRGMASQTANSDRRKLDKLSRNAGRGIRVTAEEYTAEGVEAIVRYKGSVVDILSQLSGGIRSGLSYSGAHNIKELWKNAEFVKISTSSLVESHPHDVNPI